MFSAFPDILNMCGMSHQPAVLHIIVCVLGATAAKYVLPQCDFTNAWQGKVNWEGWHLLLDKHIQYRPKNRSGDGNTSFLYMFWNQHNRLEAKRERVEINAPFP